MSEAGVVTIGGGVYGHSGGLRPPEDPPKDPRSPRDAHRSLWGREVVAKPAGLLPGRPEAHAVRNLPPEGGGSGRAVAVRRPRPAGPLRPARPAPVDRLRPPRFRPRARRWGRARGRNHPRIRSAG